MLTLWTRKGAIIWGGSSPPPQLGPPVQHSDCLASLFILFRRILVFVCTRATNQFKRGIYSSVTKSADAFFFLNSATIRNPKQQNLQNECSIQLKVLRYGSSCFDESNRKRKKIKEKKPSWNNEMTESITKLTQKKVKGIKNEDSSNILPDSYSSSRHRNTMPLIASLDIS